MPRIIVQRNNKTYKEFFLRPFQTQITVGSDGDNHLIVADLQVRKHHFVIRKKNASYFLEPLDEVPDIYLNRKLVTKPVELCSGDVIELGSHKLIFDDELNRAVATKNKKRVRRVNDRSLNQVNEETSVLVQEIDEAGGKSSVDQKITDDEDIDYCLVAIYGPYLGKVYPLNKVTTKIGRDNLLNDIIIDRTVDGKKDTSISRRHATIVHSEGFYYLLDKRSKTRTRLNNKVLKEDEVLQLSPNDEIEIVSDRVSTIFRFCRADDLKFARPRKSGSWWIRNRHRLGWLISILALIILSMLVYVYANKLRITQIKPKELTLENGVFYTFNEMSLSQQAIENGSKAIFAPSVADLNGDKYVDLVFFDNLGYLNAIDGKTKRDLWESSPQFRANQNLCATIADVDGNGWQDVVFVQFNAIVSALEGKTGIEFWSSPILGGNFIVPPIVTQLDGDGKPDVLAITREGIIHFAFGKFGEPEWQMRALPAQINACAALDYDDDGKHEIVMATAKNKILLIKFVSHEITTSELADAAGMLKNDTLMSIYVDKTGKKGALFISQTRNGKLLLNDAGRKLLRLKPLPAGFSANSTVVRLLRNANNMATPYLAIIAENRIFCYELDKFFREGEIEPLWKIQVPGGKFFAKQSILADIDKDGIQDIVVPVFPPGIGVVSGKNGSLKTSFVAKNKDEALPLGTPVVADFENDGDFDVLLRLADNRFQIFKTNSRILPGAVLWGQWNENFFETGRRKFGMGENWFYSLVILISSLLIFTIFAINFVLIERRRSFFPKPGMEKRK